MPSGGFAHYREFLVILGVAGVVVPFLLRLGINTVLGFLLVGIVLGPDVLGRLATSFPSLNAVLVTNGEALGGLGELGVVFLLFLIGLELSFERLMTMRRLVFGLGGLQVLITTVVLALIAKWLGYSLDAAVILGAALSLSSTAIVIQLLSDQKRLGTQAGRLSFAVLLLQDLAVVPILLLVSILGGSSTGPLVIDIIIALVQAAIAIAAIIVLGRFALRPLLRFVARTKSSDLFMATTLLIAVGTGVAANYAGLSMALGAFVAGLVLAETEYRRLIETIIEPFKGLLLGAFFLFIGLGIDLDQLLLNPAYIVGLAIGLIALKAIIIIGLAKAFGQGRAPSLEAALLIGSGGEFAFVVLGSALSLGLIDRGAHNDAFLVVSLTMALIPATALLGRSLSKRAAARVSTEAVPTEPPPDDHESRVIIAGFGRVGHLLGVMLAEHKILYIAIDSDPDVVARERKNGFPVYYGDAAHPEFLRRCGLNEAKALAVTMDSPARVDDVTRVARTERSDLKIVARARDERHAMALYQAGVTEAVPETIEASLQLGEALLVETGVPMGLAIASVHERRDGFRKLLNRPNRREMMETLRKRRKFS
jgi:CPA2 family monovalent cation:H+ antiporter-2